MNVLITGGAGFIGSHTVVELISSGHTPVILDNFVNSDHSVIDRLSKLVETPVEVIDADVRDTTKVVEVLKTHNIDAVIHFAAFKAVGESTQQPLKYYQNNIIGLTSLLDAMQQANVSSIIFSSSATVYGDPDSVPILETAPLKTTTNPYGETKQMAERIITDVGTATELKSVILRYFNPIGAHPSGLLGEQPTGIPNNLVPYVTQAAAGIREQIVIHGDDYETPDGTGVRDYIHVVDLAKAHVKALNYVTNQKFSTSVFNIGTGAGSSVLDIIKTFEHVNNVKVPYSIGPRRPGDIATCYASPNKAEKELGWKAELTLEDALRDAWNWQQKST